MASTEEAQTQSLADRRPSSLPAHLQQRRQRIVTAGIELLQEGEYEKVQMRDVAERAGVALGTVYRYFTSKEHLYAAVLLEWAADFFARIRAGQGQASDPSETDEDRLRRMLGRTIRGAQRFPQMTRVEIVLETSTDARARELSDEFTAEYRNAMQSALRDMSPEVAADVLTVVFSVVNRGMRLLALGRRSVREVERDLQRTVDLIFSPPPV